MSVAGLALNNQVNANQLRRWVQLHGNANTSLSSTATLLPVTVVAQAAPAAPARQLVAAVDDVALMLSVMRAAIQAGVFPR